MSHQAGVSITKLQFDKSPNIIMGGERNGPTQLEAIPRLLCRALRKCTLTLTSTVYLKSFTQRYIFAEISIISRRKILWYNPFDYGKSFTKLVRYGKVNVIHESVNNSLR